MPLCYFCEQNEIGYVFGGSYCDECLTLKKVVMCLSASKITNKIKFKMETIKQTEELASPASNTRSKVSNIIN
jgi:hypothetical protein